MKLNKMNDYIKENYLCVSDKDIADMFGRATQSVSVARRRLGLRKNKEQTQALRDKERERQAIDGARLPNFSKFWHG